MELKTEKETLLKKVTYLQQATSYPDTSKVESLETHMSWVFLTDRFVYKLKKPVIYDFLNFSSLEARYRYCMEEVSVNQPLGDDTYIGVLPITLQKDNYKISGDGEIVEWLIKMKRLPEQYLLHTAIKKGIARKEWIQEVAKKLVDFYMGTPAVSRSPSTYIRNIVKGVDADSEELIREEYALSRPLIVEIETNLLHFVIKYSEQFESRIHDGKIRDCHGDLRPEHICLAPKPLIIDRIEFSRELRLIDMVEEISFLALECEMLRAGAVGNLFFEIYKERSGDNISDNLIFFYKARRAFLRARLSIHHLQELNYWKDKNKWVNRTNSYLRVAKNYSGKLPM
ncbi:hypothetical protein [Cyclobacterium jeungdonense]|uniref:Aminoglycoside phosphotransferase domain-containing protein n=1 Tax=Cyclobacterium jeungdonense TaxID=708087 RepID=A0ABT8CCC2_9BACT|nr:hypothetical protein [Cyclobacterium jeungdonense]MDN3690170.1 hypothetical protein [Cyclobacterium jeungdonense]